MPRQIMRENLFSKIVWSALLKPILGKFYDTKAPGYLRNDTRPSVNEFGKLEKRGTVALVSGFSPPTFASYLADGARKG